MNRHFFTGTDEMRCKECGRSRFDEIHPIGFHDLPVERALTWADGRVRRVIYETLASEKLLPFDEAGRPVSFERFSEGALFGLTDYLRTVATILAGVDGPVSSNQDVRKSGREPKGGFTRHTFLNEEGGLCCAICGMVSGHEIHDLSQVM